MTSKTTTSFLFLTVVLTSATATAQTIILREGDAAGPAGHTITGLNSPDTNTVGGFAIGINTTDGMTTLSHAWGNAAAAGSGSVLLTELTGVAGYDQTSFESRIGIDDLGAICYSPSTVDVMTMVTGLDACWVDMTPIAVEGLAPLTEPMLVNRFNSAPNIIKTTGEPVWVAGLDDAGGTDVGRRLYRGAGQTAVLASGPAPAPLVANITNGGIDFDFRFSAAGSHWITPVDTDLPSAMNRFVVLDGAIATTSSMTLIGEGELIPAASGGLAGEAWANFDSFGINEAGDFMFTGDTGGDTATDEFVAFNGDIILREGDMVSDAGGTMYTLVGSIDFAAMNEQGDIAVVWDVDVSGNEALLLNGEVILVEGDEVDWTGDGVVDPFHVVTAFQGLPAIAVGPRMGGMVRVYATPDVDTAGMGILEGLLCIELPVGSPFSETCNGDGGDQMGCTDCPCGNNAPQGTVGGCLNSGGTSTRLLASGSNSIGAADLRFEASGTPASISAVLTSGDALAPANMANPCFGLSSGIQSMSLDGLRCAVQNVLRHGVRPSDANGDVGATTNGWGMPNGFFNFGAFMSGDTKHFQIIHRDDIAQVCATGQNTSQSVSTTFAP